MKKKSVKFLVALVCALMALGIAGCGKKAYKTFPEKYKLASVDVGGMTADEAKAYGIIEDVIASKPAK